MIIRMVQIGVRHSLSYSFTVKDSVYCSADAPFIPGRLDMTIRYWTGLQQNLCFNPSEGNNLVERLSYWLYQSGQQIGQLRGCVCKLPGFLKNYPYFGVEYDGRSYQLYETGLNKGLAICLYEGEKLLAIAVKEPVVIDYRDTYTLYLERESDAAVFIAAMLYYDMVEHSADQRFDAPQHSRKSGNAKMYRPELQAKYDPSFVPRIIAMEEGKP